MKAKRLFISVMALCCTMVAGAQENEVATAILQHGEGATVYTGLDALVNACAAADNGDVITLSSGTFNSANITKSISVYGAGYEVDANTDTGVTQIVNGSNGVLRVGVENATLSGVHLEGLRVECEINLGNIWWNQETTSVEDVVITKCYENKHIGIHCNVKDVDISQCVILGDIGSYNNEQLATNLFVKNCHITGRVCKMKSGSKVWVDHCIQRGGFYHDSSRDGGALDHSAFRWTNCIFTISSEIHRAVGIGSTVQNCICPTIVYCFQVLPGFDVNNSGLIEIAEAGMFEGGVNSEYSTEKTFNIANPTEWIGTDNTEIGINGGIGFNKVPATPVVKDLSATVDGKKLIVNFQTHVRPVPTTNLEPEP